MYSSVNTLQKEGMQDKAAAGGCDFVAHPIDYNHALFPRCAHGPALVQATNLPTCYNNTAAEIMASTCVWRREGMRVLL